MINSNNQKIIRKSKQIYNKVAGKYGISSKSVLWDDSQTQYFRFLGLTESLVHHGNESVLDVGCGNAELYKFLNFTGFRGDYTGYDINQKLLKQARQRFGNRIEVYNKDIMEDKVKKKFDLVLMSGLFNLDVGQDIEWVHEFLKKMFALCKRGISFNAISTHVNFKEKGMFYLSPEETLRFCIDHLSPRVLLTHHNLPYNYTVTVFKDNVWNSICS